MKGIVNIVRACLCGIGAESALSVRGMATALLVILGTTVFSEPLLKLDESRLPASDLRALYSASNGSPSRLNHNVNKALAIRAADGEKKLIVVNPTSLDNVSMSLAGNVGESLKVTPLLVAELRNAGLDYSDNYDCIVAGRTAAGGYACMNITNVRVPDKVVLPTLRYGRKGNVKTALTAERKIKSVSLNVPMPIFGSHVSTEERSAAYAKNRQMALDNCCYTYQYELPNGDLTTYADYGLLGLKSGRPLATNANNAISAPDFEILDWDQQLYFDDGTVAHVSAASTAAKQSITAAAATWNSLLAIKEPVYVLTGFSRDFYEGDSSVLGSSFSPPTYTMSSTGVAYPAALIDQILESDMHPDDSDITILYNTGFAFYFGTDGNCPYTQCDFRSVVTHELCHGLGFSSYHDRGFDGEHPNGDWATEDGVPSIFDTFLYYSGGRLTSLARSVRKAALTSNALYWDGANAKAANGNSRVKMYAPSTYEGGSSVSHWDDSVTFDTFMKWAIDDGEVHHEVDSRLIGAFKDMGWVLKGEDDSLSSISISGSSSVTSGDQTTYTCTATMSSGTTKTVTPTWSIFSGSDYASISSSGVLTAKSVTSSQSVTVRASYTEGGVTRTATKAVTVNPGQLADFEISDGVLTEYTGAGGAVTIPSSVTSIGARAFSANGDTIMSVTIPSSVGSIDDYAFVGCTSLSSITIPVGVTSIGEEVFLNCTNMTAILVEDGNPAYSSKDGILYDKAVRTLLICPEGKSGSVTIPSGVRVLANYAFENCRKLTSVTIPSTVDEIEDYVFISCDKLTAINVNSSNSTYSSYDGVLYETDRKAVVRCPMAKSGEVTIVSGTKYIDSAFNGCAQVTAVTIPSSVIYIGTRAFSGCTGLTSISIPTSCQTIEYHAFDGCTGLTSITIPDGVKTLGSSVFSGCKNLVTARIAASVTSIGYEAFEDCSELAAVRFEGNAPSSVGSRLYAYTPGGLVTYVKSGSTGWKTSGSTEIPDKWPVNDQALRRIAIWPGNGYVLVCFHSMEGFGQGDFCSRPYIANSKYDVFPEDPERYGYVFSGWFTDPVGGTQVKVGSSVPASDTILYAHWERETPVPTGVSASDGTYTDKVVVSWSASSGATSYNLYRSTTSTRPSSPTWTGVTSPYSDTTAEPGVTYYYWVSAVNSAGSTVSSYDTGYRAALSSLTISGVSSVTSGDTATYTCTATMSSGTTKTVTPAWSISSGSGYASINSSGILTAAAVTSSQSVTIQASYTEGGVTRTATKSVTVNPVPVSLSSISISGVLSVTSGNTATYTCTATMSSGSTKTVTPMWSISSGSDYASISPSGVLTAKSVTSSQSVQSVTIRARYTEGGVTKTATKSVTVNPVPVTLSSISISGVSSVTSGDTATYTCTATMSSGTTKTVTPTWSISSGSGYASINSSGILTAAAVTSSQSVTIQASYTEGGVTRTATKAVTISPDSLADFEISDGVLTEYTGAGGAVTIPSSVTSIGYLAFYGCSGLTSVSLPSTLTTIDDAAFSGCSGLRSISIPASVTYIADNAFLGCSGLVSISVAAGSQHYKVVSNCLLTKVGTRCLRAANVASVTIPEGVEDIGWASLCGCTAIQTLVLPQSLTYIDCWALENCSALTELTLPASVVEIGYGAFSGCESLERIVFEGDAPALPEQWESIYEETSDDLVTYVRRGTTGWTGVQGQEGLPSAWPVGDEWAHPIRYVSEEETLSTISISGASSVTSGSSAMYTCTATMSNGSTKTVTPAWSIPSGSSYASINSVGILTAAAVTSSQSVTIQASYTEGGVTRTATKAVAINPDPLADFVISDGVLIEYKGDGGAVTIPSSVTSIGDSAFAYCDELTSVTIPSNVTSIGYRAFYWCHGLSSVTIPSSVTSIGGAAFYDCDALTSVTIPESVTSIGDYAFCDCAELSLVTIPSSVTSIGYRAFAWCSGLTGINVDPANLYYCSIAGVLYNKDTTELICCPCCATSVTIPSSVTSICDSAFAFCDALTSVAIPSSVTSIGDEAFGFCNGLTSVTIPSGVTSIGEDVFRGCSGLMSVTIPSSVTNIGYWAFYDCEQLTAVYVDQGDGDRVRGLYDWPSAVEFIELVVRPAAPTGVSATDGEYSDKVSISWIGSRGATSYDLYRSTTSTRPSSPTWTGVTSPYSDTTAEPGVTYYYWVSADNSAGSTVSSYDTGYRAESSSFTLVDEADTYVDVERGEVAPFATAASVYDGLLYDGEIIVGSVQVKVEKGKTDKSGEFSAKVTATVRLAGQAKAFSFKGGVADATGTVMEMADRNGNWLAVTVGVKGLGGGFIAADRPTVTYRIDGARNVFSGKSAADKAAASDAAQLYQGVYNVVFDGGALSVSVDKKGKAKISGTVDGNKVSETSQLVVGKDAAVVPVVITKKINVVFCLWVMADGTVEARGIGGANAGRAGNIGAEAVFSLDDMASCWVQARAAGYEFVEDFLPWDVPVTPNGTKWIVADGAKAGQIKMDKDGEVYDKKESDNPSGLKLTFTAKTGIFKGSFKVYAIDTKGKLKSFSATVNGVVVDGIGYGTATIKNVGNVPVMIE